MVMKSTDDLGVLLRKLESVASWFEEQKDADIEKGLEKVKEGAVLLHASRARLKEIENEFAEIQKDIEQDARDIS